jgi:hypothetical protein
MALSRGDAGMSPPRLSGPSDRSESDVMWIDESARAAAGGVVYVIVGVRLTDDARSLDPPGKVVASIPEVPVRSFAIEGRGEDLDRRDRSSILDAVRRMNRRPAPEIVFVSKTASPLLWVADAVSSIASCHFGDERGSDHWWRQFRPPRITLLRTDA